MKNLGGLKYLFEIEATRSRQGIFLSQMIYVLDFLSKVGLPNYKSADTPVVHNHKLGGLSDQVPIDKERYKKLFGKLIYLSHTRPDIANVVNIVNQFMHYPSEDNMDAVILILLFLKSSHGKWLMFSKNSHLNIDGYTNVNWARNISDKKSTSGYCTFVHKSGYMKEQKAKGNSINNAKAEFQRMAKGRLCEFYWLKGC